jgi:hypothetical protein
MNKTTNSLFKSLLISTAFFACTNLAAQTKSVSKPKSTIVSSVAKAPVAMIDLDLSSTGIDATIQVPAGVAIIKDEYSILIGDGKNILIEIEETSETFSKKVDFVKSNTVRGFVKFVQQDDNSFIALMNPFGSKQEFDFAYLTEINGKKYMLHDRGQDLHDNVQSVASMLAMAKTIKGK